MFADRFARDERRARDGTGDLLDGVGLAGAADEVVAGGRGRPGLPLQIVRLDRAAKADIRFGDENIDGLHLRDRLGRRRSVVRPAGEICGYAAGADGDGQDHNSCGIHYASLSTLRCDASAAVMGVDQLFVKAWLMRRV
jgi:hypothetical protein